MDILIGWRPFECEFNGEKITMELKPLTRGAYLAIEPYMGNPNPKKEEETIAQYMARLTPEERAAMSRDGFKLQELIKDIGPEHIRDLQGVTVDGQQPTWDQMGDVLALNPLSVQIMSELAMISSLPGVEAKNSKGPSVSIPSENVNAVVSSDGPHGAGSISSSPALTTEETAEIKRAVKATSQRVNGSGKSGPDPAA